MSARAIAVALGKAKQEGRGYRCICPVHGGLSLNLADGCAGKLLVTCWSGCDPILVLAALRRLGLLRDDGERRLSPEAQAALDRKRHTEEEQRRRQRTDEARAIWRQTQPASGTLVDIYLRRRAVTLPIPPTLRYHPALKHGPTGLMLPAMIAAVQAPDRGIAGIHRTFLRMDGSDKAGVTDPKMSLGPIGTGAVRLALAGEELAIGEGIETCLSFMQATGLPTWAALSTGGMCSIILPPLPLASVVYIAADMDANGAGEVAAEQAARRFTAEGRKVKIARPISGKDFNDAIRASVAA